MTTTPQLSKLDIESLPNRRQKTHKEWSSACPQCGGTDRFLFWPDKGNFYCRRCELSGFILDTNQRLMTDEQREAWKRADLERKQKEAEARQSAIERLQTKLERVHWYHSQVNQALDYWYSQGLVDSTIKAFCLGYCPACPVEPESPSYVIPYFQSKRLINLRHRLQFPNGHGKYRPEFAGLGNQIFNLDTLNQADEIDFGMLDSGLIVLVEGEVKTIVLEQYGFKAIGIPGANSWKEEWAEKLQGVKGVYVALDPGANGQADKIAQSLASWNIRTKVCQFPVKPDDFLVKYGGNTSDFIRFLKQGKRV